MIHFKETRYGFEFGAARVLRYFADKAKGSVTLGIQTPKHENGVQVYVTKTGKVRVFDERGEWTPPSA